MRALLWPLLVLIVTSCVRTPTGTLLSGATSVASTVAPYGPQPGGVLSIVSPLGSTPASGGVGLRVAFLLVDRQDQPVEEAAVQSDLWLPSGELLASFPCTDQGQGRYVCPHLSLPLRGAEGIWRVTGGATWDGGQQAEVAGTFWSDPSISEMYHAQYGFWIEPPRIFGQGTGFFSLSGTGGLHFEDWLSEDGSGYVILDNYRFEATGITFAALEVHWRHEESPVDEAAAVALAQSLVGSGLHHQDPDTPLAELAAAKVAFHGRSAWQVVGSGSEYYVAKAAAAYPVEWLIFRCPDSDWLWTLALHTNREAHIDSLRAVRESFECPEGRLD